MTASPWTIAIHSSGVSAPSQPLRDSRAQGQSEQGVLCWHGVFLALIMSLPFNFAILPFSDFNQLDFYRSLLHKSPNYRCDHAPVPLLGIAVCCGHLFRVSVAALMVFGGMSAHFVAGRFPFCCW